jgi:predicted ATP-dependent serine protease
MGYDYPKDYNFECSNCGKPMSFRLCGMCWSCEAEYNEYWLDDEVSTSSPEEKGNTDTTEESGDDDDT